jgi:hypothetical protein
MGHRYVTLLLLVALLVAGLQLARVASKCESGWGLIVTQWQDATLGLIGLGHTSIGHSAPAEQAHFWLSEVDRITDEYPMSASVYMGAAWILDSPDIGFLENHVRQSDFARAFPQMGIELDEDAISLEKKAFRDQCIDKCLEMASRATQLEPTDVRWWRMCALLLFEGDIFYSGQDFKPRGNNWLEILDECKSHDPDNALYDYLAALQLWNESASYDWPAEKDDDPANDDGTDGAYEQEPESDLAEEPDELKEYWILTVQDADGFALALQRFHEAQEKHFLAVGEAGYASIAEFLACSRLRKADQAEVAVSRLVTSRHSSLFHPLWRWQNVRADNARTTRESSQEMTILQQNLRLYEQCISPEETTALNTLNTFGILRQFTYEAIEKLNKSEPTILDSVQMDRIRQREEELRIETSTLQAALQALDDESYPGEYAASWSAVFAAVTSMSSAILLISAGVFLLVAKMLSRHIDEEPVFGMLRHAIAWIIGCGSTFAVLGMAPAEMVSHEAQRLAIIASIWTLATCITAVTVLFVIRLLRLRKIRFRLITLFAVMTGVAFLSFLWPLMEASFLRIARYQPELWLHAKGWSGIDAEVLRTAMQLEKRTWYWAFMQWLVHGGPYIGLAVSLLLTSVWYMWRSARNANQGLLNYWTQEGRSRWAACFSFVGRSAFAAAMCWVFLYLCVAPKSVQLAEAEFQHQMRYCRDPKSHWTEIKNAQAVVVATVDEMKIIREQVHFELFGEGVLEMDFSQE